MTLKDKIKFEVEKLSPKRGDLLVFKVKGNKMQKLQQLASMVNEIFPYEEYGIKWLVLRDDIEVSINNKQLMELLKYVKCHDGKQGDIK